VNRKSDGIVIRVATLISMGDDGPRPFRIQKLNDASRQIGEIAAGLLVGNAEADRARAGCVSRQQRIRQLGTPGSRIIGRIGEAVADGIAAISRRAIGHMHDQRVSEAAKLGAYAERLIVGMRGDNHHAVWDRSARHQRRDDRLARICRFQSTSHSLTGGEIDP
jgi:hypothetical protein